MQHAHTYTQNKMDMNEYNNKGKYEYTARQKINRAQHISV